MLACGWPGNIEYFAGSPFQLPRHKERSRGRAFLCQHGDDKALVRYIGQRRCGAAIGRLTGRPRQCRRTRCWSIQPVDMQSAPLSLRLFLSEHWRCIRYIRGVWVLVILQSRCLKKPQAPGHSVRRAPCAAEGLCRIDWGSSELNTTRPTARSTRHPFDNRRGAFPARWCGSSHDKVASAGLTPTGQVYTFLYGVPVWCEILRACLRQCQFATPLRAGAHCRGSPQPGANLRFRSGR
jgi:hypothetical protein